MGTHTRGVTHCPWWLGEVKRNSCSCALTLLLSHVRLRAHTNTFSHTWITAEGWVKLHASDTRFYAMLTFTLGSRLQLTACGVYSHFLSSRARWILKEEVGRERRRGRGCNFRAMCQSEHLLLASLGFKSFPCLWPFSSLCINSLSLFSD